jgi:hypothetical protein
MNSTSLIAAAFAATMLSTSLAAAQVPCTQWDVSGKWQAKQGSFVIDFELHQAGTSLQGIGEIYVGSRHADGGPVDGSLKGDTFELTGYWTGGSVGVYRGAIGATGRIEGWTHDKRNPGSSAPWYSVNRMNCLAREAAASPPQPAEPASKPGKVLGKKQKIDPNAAEVLTEQGGISAALDPSPNCASGYVWRVARPDDLVCVTPAARQRVAQENQAAASLVDRGGDYGKNSCIIGYVWRDAFEGDGVCVTPAARDLAAQENQQGPSRRAQ